MRVLDLFAGIGGMSLGLEMTGGFETVAFCEIDTYARRVLKKHWPRVMIYNDIRRLNGKEIKKECGRIDLISGGYPCQPFSVAGKRRGHEDDRDLWPEMFRIIKEIRPKIVLLENVTGHISMGLDKVLSDLEALGYTVWVFVIPACAVDAPHRRDRVWILGHTVGDGQHEPTFRSRTGKGKKKQAPGAKGPGMFEGPGPTGEALANPEGKSKRPRFREGGEEGKRGRRLGYSGGSVLAHSPGERVEGNRPSRLKEPQAPGRLVLSGRNGSGTGAGLWPPESGVGRMAHGIPARVDRLKCLGNAVVPQVVEQIGYAILAAEKEGYDGKTWDKD